MKHITRIFLFSLFSFFLFHTAQAKTVTITFKGTVDSVNGTSVYSPGQVVEGTYSFDDSIPNSSPVPDHGEYRVMGPLPPETGFTSLKIGIDTFTPNVNTEEATVFVGNDIPDWNGVYPTIDDVGLTVCCQAGSLSNGLNVDHMYVAFNDGPNNPLSSNDLAPALSALSSFDTKTMGIFGSDNFGGWYDIQVKIDTVSVSGASAGPTGPGNLVAFDSVITDFSGSPGPLFEFLQQGESISGNFTFDPTLQDRLSNPDIGLYETTGDSKNHVKLNIAGETFTSDNGYHFKIEIRDYPPEVAGPDTYILRINRIASVAPLANGLTINEVEIEFVNFPAQNLSNTDLLSSTPSDLSVWYISNLIISGRHSDGISFSLRAALSDLAQGQESVAPMATEELFPASGTTQMGQRFDAMAILNESRAPITKLYAKMHNGRGQYNENCGFDTFTITNQQRILCYMVSDSLIPGMNVLRISVHFADGTKKYYLNRWNVIE